MYSALIAALTAINLQPYYIIVCSKSQLGWLNLPHLLILLPSMTAKQQETKNVSAVCNPHSDPMTSPGWTSKRKKLNEVSRINQKTVADEWDDVTTQSGLVQLMPILAVWKSNVCSEAKA